MDNSDPIPHEHKWYPSKIEGRVSEGLLCQCGANYSQVFKTGLHPDNENCKHRWVPRHNEDGQACAICDKILTVEDVEEERETIYQDSVGLARIVGQFRRVMQGAERKHPDVLIAELRAILNDTP